MFLGDWLQFRKGTCDAKIDKMQAGSISQYSVSVLMSLDWQAMLRVIYSRGEIHSMAFILRFLTGRISLASVVEMQRSGKMGCLPQEVGLSSATSVCSLMVPLHFMTLRLLTTFWASSTETQPTSLPLRRTWRALVGQMTFKGMRPREGSFLVMVSSASRSGCVRGQQHMEMWLRSPQGPPSGVWTGQMKPQVSGRSFLTVVVFISAKYAPRWTERKWERNLELLSLSAMMVKPEFCIRSSPLWERRLPVARKFSILEPIDVCKSTARLMQLRSFSLYTSWPLCTSLIIFSLTPNSSSSSFSLRIAMYRCPVSSTSWFTSESRLSALISSVTSVYSFSTIMHSRFTLSSFSSKWMQMCSRKKISPTCTSVVSGLITPSSTRSSLPKYDSASFQVQIARDFASAISTSTLSDISLFAARPFTSIQYTYWSVSSFKARRIMIIGTCNSFLLSNNLRKMFPSFRQCNVMVLEY